MLNEGSFCVMFSSSRHPPPYLWSLLSGWVVSSSCPCWPWPLVKVRSSSLAAAPARRMTASALTLKLLFSSSFLLSTHSNLNWRTADGIGLPQSLPPAFLQKYLGLLQLQKLPKSLLFCPSLLWVSWHLQIACFVSLTVINPQIFNLQWCKTTFQKLELANV